MFVPLTPIRFLHRAVDLFGAKIGVVSGDRCYTYAQFGERCERLATALGSLGIGAGDRVAYLSFNNNQLLEGYYGVIQARAVVMPLNVRLAPPELEAILNHAGARMLIYEGEFAPLVAGHLHSACPQIEKFVAIDGPALDDGGLTYEELLAAGHPERADIMSFDENSIAELFYTSGSTGTPKGVMLSHRAIYLHAMAVGMTMQNPQNIVDLHTIPLFHANGWGRPQASTMLGTRQVMVRRFDPTHVFELIELHKATEMALVPTMANALLNAPNREKYDLSSLTAIMFGGTAASPELVERMEDAFKCRCFAGYGLTESCPVLTMSRDKGIAFTGDDDRWRHQAMAGWSVPGVEVRVVDLQMRDVPRDAQSIGEVVARGDNIMDGYFRDPEGTRSVIEAGWLHTGDMAVWDAEGYINIVDRKKEIIISGGENISSIEVERAVFSHPEVFECAVVAAPDPTWGEVPAVLVVRKPGSTLTCEALIEYLSQRLARYKLPRRVEFSDEPLPKTGTGKIRKMILRERFWEGHSRRVQG
jgi:fatty-acyl-CoA synthase